MFWLLLFVSLALLFYFIFIKPFRCWTKRGALQPNIWEVWLENIRGLLQLRAQADTVQILYNSFPNERYVGIYQFLSPLLFLRDPELIKQIAVKDFDHFLDHDQFVSEEDEPLWGKNLFSLKGEKWKDMRATLSPSFTSSKMRGMFCFMNECAQHFVQHFQRDNSDTVILEIKDAFTRYTNDVIASSAFGITCDSLKYPENEFYLMGKEATDFGGFWKNLSFVIMFLFPRLAKLFGMQVFNKRVSAFFRKLVKENMEARERNGIVRPDMIHLLMEAKKGKLKHEDNVNGAADSGFAVIKESSLDKEEKRQKRQLTDDDITAQALIFFFAGFESVSLLMSFTAYELAINPDVQERLREEVDETLKNCNDTITYEALLKMKYLDMVISEGLRKWPAGIATDRVCVKPYTIQPVKQGEKYLHLQKGDVVWLPIYAIQRDPKYYPEPDRFDPERFSDENKSDVSQYTFLSFGVGPRSCIGNTFALLEAKAVIFHILSKFEIVVVEKTRIPIKLSKDQFNLSSEGGIWLGLKPRNTDEL